MINLARFITWWRGRQIDREKAWDYLADEAEAAFREAVGDYDQFVEHVRDVNTPSLMLGTARDAGGHAVPVHYALKDLFGFGVVQGGQGTGKTFLQAHILAACLAHGLPVGCFDFKEGLHELALQWCGAIAYRMDAAARQAFIKRLHIVNPFGATLAPFNVCHVPPGTSRKAQAYDITDVLSRMDDHGLSTSMGLALRHLILLLMEHDLSLVEAPQILQDPVLRKVLVERSTDAEVKTFFHQTYEHLPRPSIDALLRRLTDLLFFDPLRLMLGADTCTDYKGIFDRGDPLFGFLGKGPDIPEEFMQLFGTLHLQFLFKAAYATRGGARQPYQLVLDEFFHLLSPSLSTRFERGLDSLRSFGIFFTLIMHQFGQISPNLRRAILTHCYLAFIFRSEPDNARHFGRFLPDVDPDYARAQFDKTGEFPSPKEMQARQSEHLERLPARHFFLNDRRRPYRAIRIAGCDIQAPHKAVGLSERALDRFIDAEGIRIGAVGQSKAELERQIDARQDRLQAWLRPPIAAQTAANPPAPQMPASPDTTSGRTASRPKSKHAKLRIG